MGLFKIVTEDIFKNKEIKEKGSYVGIPIPFPRLAEYIPIIEKGTSVGVLAATGAGKSRFVRWLYIYHAYKFYKETGYPIRIIYFPLEDSKEKVYRNMLCHYLNEVHNIYINLQELDSKGQRTLPDFVKEKIIESEEFFNEFEKIVTIVDGLSEPTEIYTYCENYAKATGKVTSYQVEGSDREQLLYTADNDVHTIVVVDNMSNIDVEKGTKDEREAIVKFCKTYVRGRLCNFFKFTVVQVLQQDFASERQSFTREGSSITAKLEPSLAGIGDSKTIARSMHLVFGIFHPSRFDMMSYPPVSTRGDASKSYRLDILGNRFRVLSVLKANDSDFGQKIAFHFDAVTESMKEMPPVGSAELEAIYAKIMKNSNNKPEQYSKLKKAVIIEDEEAPF